MKELPYEIETHQGIPPNYRRVDPGEMSIPGVDIYLNYAGLWCLSKTPNRVKSFVTYARPVMPK